MIIIDLIWLYKIDVDGKKKNRLIGGKRASIEMFYSQVSLRWQQALLCAGTIISTSHILTATSCIVFESNTFAANVEILSGTADQLDAQYPGYLSEVSLLINHPDYDPRTPWINDVRYSLHYIIKKINKLLIFNWSTILAY